MKKYIILLLSTLFLNACKENENITLFEQDQSYIYFGYPNPDERINEKFLDSIYYNFSLDEDLFLSEKTIAIPMHIGGLSQSNTRTYAIDIAESSSYSPELISLSAPVIAGGQYTDTLYLHIKRAPVLAEREQFLILNLHSNQDFKTGHHFNTSFKVVFSDILSEPPWWRTWRYYLGPFHKEVLQKWMQIYYLGADISPELGGGDPGPFYYWNNMPNTSVISWYPITHMYISVLKEYFDNTIVYPDGDSSKERILIP